MSNLVQIAFRFQTHPDIFHSLDGTTSSDVPYIARGEAFNILEPITDDATDDEKYTRAKDIICESLVENENGLFFTSDAVVEAKKLLENK
jgi:hypothetical protein